LTRGCRNLVQQYAKSKDVVKSGLFQKFVNEFQRIYQREANA
jgi:hypothetical protein